MDYSKALEEVVQNKKSDILSGLSDKEAGYRLKKHGLNEIKEKRRKNIFFRILEQFNDFMIIILLAASVISYLTGRLNNDGSISESIIILFIVVVNAILGVIQESKAEKSIEELKKISSPEVDALRDGRKIRILTKNIVPGDIVFIETGDVLCADVRLIECCGLEIDESTLTGESMPVTKNADAKIELNAPLAERYNMAYQGTFVTCGFAKAIVLETGMNTEVGKIAGMLLSADIPQTPLQKKLAEVGKVLGVLALAICAVVFVLGVFNGNSPLDMFITAISLAVAAIPEGLPAVVTIMLAIGVKKMSANGAIIRNLSSVETLGSAEVICSDKTGTLTQNKMEITSIYPNNLQIISDAILCCKQDTKNPTELAIIKYGKINGIRADNRAKIIDEESFSSVKKRMSVLYDNGRMITKGAPEILISLCSEFMENGKKISLTPKIKKELLDKNEKLARIGHRIIGVAYKNNVGKITENNLVFLGLIAMVDPPRPEAADAVKRCIESGMRVVMITGDHIGTAISVARAVGIYADGKKAINGRELDAISDDELVKTIDEYSVFARATPEHKVRIVRAWQKNNKICAMTGDGVNDAPALKLADIGTALGKTGTEVSKLSSDMILTDDNFATIVSAVGEGRKIYQNIRKAIKFLLSSNIGEIFTVFVAILMSMPPPLLAIQLLWINLITDSFPALALGVDPPDHDLMRDKPNNQKLFDRAMVSSIIAEGLMIGGLALFAFSVGLNIFGDLVIGRTMAFCVLSLSQLVHSFNMRSEKSVLGVELFKNHKLVLSLIAGILLQVGVVCFLPEMFGVKMLSLWQWRFVAVLSLMPLVIVELQKLFIKVTHK